MKKSIDNTIIKQRVKGKPPTNGFKKGVSGNPAGRPKGRRNLQTIFNEAIEHIAALGKSKGVDADDAEMQIAAKVIDRARAGDHRFIKIYYEYRYGKPKHQEDDVLKVEVEGGFTSDEKATMAAALANAGLDKITKSK